MAGVRKCRSCGTALFGTDRCNNPGCARAEIRQPRLSSHSVISVTSPHGFHAPAYGVGPWITQYQMSH